MKSGVFALREFFNRRQKSPPNPTVGTKRRGLDAAISSITKSYGESAIMRLGVATALRSIEVIPTGALAIDLALGVGGVPRGRVIEIFVPESSGKTTLMLHVIVNAQKAGGLAAFIDAEHAFDPGYAKKLGVNLDDLLVSQPDSGEEALTICETLARSNAIDVIVVDSAAALGPKAVAKRSHRRASATPSHHRCRSSRRSLLHTKNVRHLVHGLARGLGVDVGVNAADGGAVVADDVPGHHVAYASILEQAGRSVAQTMEAECVLRMPDAAALAGDRRFSRDGKPGGDENVVELLGQAPVVPAVIILFARAGE